MRNSSLMNKDYIQIGSKGNVRLPVSTATLAWAGRDTCKKPATTELLLNMGIKSPSLLPFLHLPQHMVALLSFLCGGFTVLSFAKPLEQEDNKE